MDQLDTSDTNGRLPAPQARGRRLSRKKLLTAAGLGGVATVGAVGLTVAHSPIASAFAAARPENHDNTSGDTPAQIFTAALIAEDLATTFYYNGLVGLVIQDPNLAGLGGTATNPTATNSNPGNVDYLRAAISEEIAHANLLRSLIGGSAASGDPVQTFYFPTGSFDTLPAFLGLLDALESAFIGAYLAATKEFAQMASDARADRDHNRDDRHAYTSATLEYFAQVAGSIMGIEAEHRVLGRVISNMNPANNLNYEQQDGIQTVYNGAHSAVVALTPFLGTGAGKTAYSFATALAGASAVSLPASGGLPTP